MSLSNQCPDCKSKDLKITGMNIVHADTEIYVDKYCADCGSSFIAVYQFDRHEHKD